MTSNNQDVSMCGCVGIYIYILKNKFSLPCIIELSKSMQMVKKDRRQLNHNQNESIS